MASLRSRVENARLKDENVSLSHAVAGLNSSLSAHLRFGERVGKEQRQQTESLRTRVAECEEAVQKMRAELEQARQEKTKAEKREIELRKHLEQSAEQLKNMDKLHVDELSRVYIELEHARARQKEQSVSQKTDESFDDQRKVIEDAARFEEEQQAWAEKCRELERDVQSLKQDNEALLSQNRKLSADLQDTEDKRDVMNRELAIKDKQIQSLRDQLQDQRAEFSSSQQPAGTSKQDDDSLIEFLEEEMAVMKVRFEGKIQDLEMQLAKEKRKRLDLLH